MRIKPKRRGSRPISRVLSKTVIHLGCASPHTSSSQPGNTMRATRSAICRSSPIWPCFEWGLPCHPRYRKRGALLPHHFTLTGAEERHLGGVFSVALSVGSRPPGVTWHSALRSPDFPPRRLPQRLPGRLPKPIYHGRAGSTKTNAPQNTESLGFFFQRQRFAVPVVPAPTDRFDHDGSDRAHRQLANQHLQQPIGINR